MKKVYQAPEMGQVLVMDIVTTSGDILPGGGGNAGNGSTVTQP